MRYQSGKVWLLVIGIALTPACSSEKKESAPAAARELSQKEKLGKLMVNDRNLSTPPGQACADCHAPETGFSNPNSSFPVSQGVHKDRFGNLGLAEQEIGDIAAFLHTLTDNYLVIGKDRLRKN